MSGRNQTAFMATVIGFTIVAAAAILLVMLIAWGNTASLLTRNYLVAASLANVGELKPGAPVKIGGFQVGRVAAIRRLPGQPRLEVVMEIGETHAIPRKSTVRVATAGLVGDTFLEIMPGESGDSVARASVLAEAETLESSSAPDLPQLMARIDRFGEQITILTTNLNEIIGEEEFRVGVKRLVSNMEAASYQANLILQRGQKIVDNVELATRNIAQLSTKLSGDLSRLSEEVGQSLARTAARAEALAGKADAALDNLDGGISDVRRAVNGSLGNPELAADLAAGAANVRKISGVLAERGAGVGEILDNLREVSANLRGASGKVGGIIDAVDPEAVSGAVNRISGAVASLTEVVERIKAEPVLALSVNKAADRIVKMKFDEMSRQPALRTADGTLDEINRWLREALRRGWLEDPSFAPGERPYLLEPAKTP